jgi:hypothetical protein
MIRPQARLMKVQLRQKSNCNVLNQKLNIREQKLSYTLCILQIIKNLGLTNK